MNLDQTLDRLRALSTPGSIPGRCITCISVMRLTLGAIAENPRTRLPEFTSQEVESEKAALRSAYPDVQDCPDCDALKGMPA
jgi:hypothetical protein